MRKTRDDRDAVISSIDTLDGGREVSHTEFALASKQKHPEHSKQTVAGVNMIEKVLSKIAVNELSDYYDILPGDEHHFMQALINEQQSIDQSTRKGTDSGNELRMQRDSDLDRPSRSLQSRIKKIASLPLALLKLNVQCVSLVSNAVIDAYTSRAVCFEIADNELSQGYDILPGDESPIKLQDISLRSHYMILASLSLQICKLNLWCVTNPKEAIKAGYARSFTVIDEARGIDFYGTT